MAAAASLDDWVFVEGEHEEEERAQPPRADARNEAAESKRADSAPRRAPWASLPRWNEWERTISDPAARAEAKHADADAELLAFPTIQVRSRARRASEQLGAAQWRASAAPRARCATLKSFARSRRSLFAAQSADAALAALKSFVVVPAADGSLPALEDDAAPAPAAAPQPASAKRPAKSPVKCVCGGAARASGPAAWRSPRVTICTCLRVRRKPTATFFEAADEEDLSDAGDDEPEASRLNHRTGYPSRRGRREGAWKKNRSAGRSLKESAIASH
jgi:hypothetical protein